MSERGTGFVWDERSAQPEQMGDRKSNFFSGISELFPMLKMTFTNMLHMLPLLFRYRYYRKKSIYKTIRPESIGCAVTYDDERKDELIQAFHESGAGSLLVRVLSWEEDSYSTIADFVKQFGLEREQVVIAAVQDRACVADPELWKKRFAGILEHLYPLASYFQIGHVPNRKKWGFRSPREFNQFCKAVSELKRDDIKFIGPSSIDFELSYTDAILSGTDKGFFDVFNSLLYVDRRGAPEIPQWASFETMNKIRITKALGDINGLETMPFWITEVNWPLKDTGKYSPAAKSVCVSEEEYADYLARYYLLSLSTGLPERILWWELSAHGYGLLDPKESSLRKRPGFQSFKTIASILPGWTNQAFLKKGTVCCCSFRKDGNTLCAVWTVDGEGSVRVSVPVQQATILTGESIEIEKDLAVSSSPVFLEMEGEISIEEAFII